MKFPRLVLNLGAVALLAMSAVPAQARGYTPKGTCEGYPRVDIKTPAGYCVALVADERQGLKFPRRLLEVAPGRFWLTDMGGWDKGRGRLLEMTLQKNGAAPVFKTLLEGLDRPHGLALGPDGKAYIGEATRIWRSPVTGALTQEVVIDQLPGDGAHPLKEMAFGSGGKLYVNVGSFSDSCKNDAQQQPRPCPEVAGDKPRAAVYEAVLGGAGLALQSFKPFATGLRNSMALAVVVKAGQPDVVLQGENSIDYPDVATPHEEVNVLQAGANYGWPYCVENQKPARGYEAGATCATTRAPVSLWPAHVAPLQMLIAPAKTSAWAGQALVAWHGYKPAGQRVMAFTLDTKGQPAGGGTEILGNWAAKTGVRPQGAPTGLALAADGHLFVVEDRNRTVLMLGRDSPP